jgi:crotonobetainyl-CoA:carnitine CoA-transferase CaiB-like acyl-CoA transferase
MAGIGPANDMGLIYSVIQVPELLEPKYETPAQRTEFADELDALIEPWLLQHDKYEVFNAMQQIRATVGVGTTPEDLLKDPGYEARGFWTKIDHPQVGELSYPGTPWLMSDTERQATRAPLLGEHNQEIFQGKLGYSEQDISRLSQNGVI